MHPLESTRRDDVILAVLLLLIGVPRAVLAILDDRPIGAEGTLSLLCVALALLILLRRNSRARSTRTTAPPNPTAS